MKEPKEEMRKDKRFPSANPLSTSFVVMGDFVHMPNVVDVKGEILDLSNKGMKIRVNGKPPEKGAIIRIQVPIAIAPNNQIVVPILSQVRWVKGISKRDRQFGIKFIA
ncbi:MAG TPA: PilZ domain-containing protein [Candidatus Wunengus sp. YC60]|uniref:PilZ domain-containing protein n=1 Tax=Candidatus Wunengus sp. YC60 TaxID=3367697 RepID=UPI0040251DCA